MACAARMAAPPCTHHGRLSPWAPRRLHVETALRTYKERFVARLPMAERLSADFSRPVFLAAAFLGVAHREKVGLRAVLAGSMCGCVNCVGCI